MAGVYAPGGGHAGAVMFGNPGEKAEGKFVAPAPKGKGGAHKGFDDGFDDAKKGGRHHHHGKKFPRRGFPVVVYPLGGSYAVTTGGEDVDVDEDDGESGEAENAGDGVFAITNRTDREMTVYDNGKAVCVLAPGVRCSFDISKGAHDVSARVGQSEVRREIPHHAGGKMIVVWEALKKAE